MGKLLSDTHPIVDAVMYGPSDIKKRKKNEPDKLAQDAASARQAGMSYGRWKAMQNPVTITKPDPAKVVPDLECAGMIKKICAHCSKEFFTSRRTRQIYCGRPCRDSANYHKKLKKEMERKNESC